MKSLFTTCKQGHSLCHPWICVCYGMEIGDGLCKTMKNDRILSFLPLTLCEKKLNLQHADIIQLLKVLRSDWCRQHSCVVHTNVSVVTRCSFSPHVLHMQISTCLLNLEILGMPLSIIFEELKCKVPLTKLVVTSPPLPAASPTPDIDCVAWQRFFSLLTIH